MIERLIRAALELRVVVVCLAALLMFFGVQKLSQTPLDVFPEFAPPLIEIQTEAPGLSTAEVEALVSIPLESALNGTPWLKTLRSKSVLGLSSVVLLFEDGTDLLRARQLVGERLQVAATTLPAVARPPVMLSPLSSTSRAMKIGVSSKTLSQSELSTLVRWTVRPRLMAVPGVANVAVWGQRDRQLQVLVEPERLAANQVTLDQVLRATGDATRPAAGGFIDTPNQRLAVTHLPAVVTLDDLMRVPVLTNRGTPLALGDVATLAEGHAPPIGDAIINDGPGLLLIIEKQPWGNTLEVTRGVEQALEALRPGLAGVELDSTIFRPATYIEQSLGNLEHALWLGCALVVLILGIFLWNWRTAVISVVAIPLSLVTAGLVLHWRGGTVNTMVLAGLVIALGEVVDDAIIDVENIVRRLHLNARLATPRPAFQVVLEGALEVRSSVVYATLIVALVFLPVFMLDGLAGAFFRPLATSYLLAVMASLVVALLVTPAMSLLLLPRALENETHERESPVMAPLRRWYRAVLERVMKKPARAPLVLVTLLALTAAAVPLLGEDFLPHFREYDFLMHWVEKPGASIEAVDRITITASREIRAVEGVRNLGSHIGRAEVADEVVGPNFAELWISVDPKVDYDATVARVQEIVDGHPGLYRDLLTYLRERIKEVLSGGSGAVVVRLFGDDLMVLRSEADALGKTLAKINGVADLKVEAQVVVPQLEVKIRTDAALALGVSAADIRRTIATVVRGTKVGEVVEAQRTTDVVVWSAPGQRNDPQALRELRVELPNGRSVPLDTVAEVRIAPTPNVIQRESSSRRIDVSFNVKGRDLGAVARDVQAELSSHTFPRGYHPELLGEYAARQRSQQQLMLFTLLSLLGIFLVLYGDFGELRLSLLVFASLPFALVGAVGALLLSDRTLSLGALVGFVTVIGIAARNGILLVSHYRHLEKEERVPFGLELVMRGSEERLRPILMTALATGLALVPTILGGVRAGNEIERPLAIVIVGGLVTSTLLNLFLMPALYLRFSRSSASASRRTP
ncbi:MAG: efflux RND transporter permease subunit [Archangium sp.]